MNSKVVFTFQRELQSNPRFLDAIQSATLDPAESVFGLKGTHGLLGTEEWWRNIENGVIRSVIKTGVVAKIIHYDESSDEEDEGQDVSDDEPSFKMDLDAGGYEYHQCFVNDRADLALYKVGAKVKMLVALDEGKSRGEKGDIRYLDVVLEVSVSE